MTGGNNFVILQIPMRKCWGWGLMLRSKDQRAHVTIVTSSVVLVWCFEFSSSLVSVSEPPNYF